MDGPDKRRAHKSWIGVFNRTDQGKHVTLTKSFLGLEKDATLYNIWRGRKQHPVTASYAAEIDISPDGVLLFRYE